MLFVSPRARRIIRRVRTPTLGRIASLALPAPTPFAIVSRGRTGSSLLGTLLDSHPHIHYYHEIFGESALTHPEIAAEVRRLGPIPYLEQFYRREWLERAAGVKFLYYQLEQPYKEHWNVPGLPRVMDYLKSRTDIRIIHVKRINRLATYVSARQAYLSRQYAVINEKKRRVQQVEIDPERCEAEFRRVAAWEEQFDRELADHPFLTVLYKTLAADHQSETNRVLNFLGLPPRELRTPMKQQRREPLRDVVTNYDDLKAHFRGTRWESLFEE